MTPSTEHGRAASPQRLAFGLTTAAVAAGAVVTALVAMRVVDFGVNSPSAHLVLNSFDAFIALLVAFLVHGRFVRSHQVRDLLLSQGLFLLAVAGLGLSYVGQIFPAMSERTLEVWLPLAVRVLGVALLAAAALAGERRFDVRRPRWPLAAPLLAVGAIALLLWGFGSSLPVAFAVGDLPLEDELPLLTGHWLLLVAQGAGALCFLVASAVFTVRAARSGDELLTWVGPAFALGGFARLNYLLFPSIYTDWLYTGDVLRTGCHLLLLVGAAREIQQHWHAQAVAAVLEDRRRLARELHDGVVQELSYIRSASHSLPAADSRAAIVEACDRALGEARAAVHALGSPSGEPLSATLERAVRELAGRYDVSVTCDLSDRVVVAPEQRHALLRIAREAVHNAVRHGDAGRIEVMLRAATHSSALCVRDDGVGFPVSQEGCGGGSGYGLTSMRDRAQQLPGTLEIESRPGKGTEVRVEW